jgi:hypothetical protein
MRASRLDRSSAIRKLTQRTQRKATEGAESLVANREIWRVEAEFLCDSLWLFVPSVLSFFRGFSLSLFGFELGRPVGEMIEGNFVRAVELQGRH